MAAKRRSTKTPEGGASQPSQPARVVLCAFCQVSSNDSLGAKALVWGCFGRRVEGMVGVLFGYYRHRVESVVWWSLSCVKLQSLIGTC